MLRLFQVLKMIESKTCYTTQSNSLTYEWVSAKLYELQHFYKTKYEHCGIELLNLKNAHGLLRNHSGFPHLDAENSRQNCLIK